MAKDVRILRACVVHLLVCTLYMMDARIWPVLYAYVLSKRELNIKRGEINGIGLGFLEQQLNRVGFSTVDATSDLEEW
jgi:hypothetical protein